MQHDKHRERMRKKFCDGVELEDHEILEMLLFYSMPRVNTNEIAHDIIDTNGSLTRALCRSTDELTDIKGVGDKYAVLMGIVNDVARRFIRELCDTDELMTSEVELNKYICSLFALSNVETAYLLAFDRSKRLVDTVCVGEGIFSQGQIYVHRTINSLKKAGAVGVIVAHNHPNGIAAPSALDVVTAGKLDTIFDNAEMNVVGHYVYADGKITAFKGRRGV